jgi:hypothetical protein
VLLPNELFKAWTVLCHRLCLIVVAAKCEKVIGQTGDTTVAVLLRFATRGGQEEEEDREHRCSSSSSSKDDLGRDDSRRTQY